MRLKISDPIAVGLDVGGAGVSSSCPICHQFLRAIVLDFSLTRRASFRCHQAHPLTERNVWMNENPCVGKELGTAPKALLELTAVYPLPRSFVGCRREPHHRETNQGGKKGKSLRRKERPPQNGVPVLIGVFQMPPRHGPPVGLACLGKRGLSVCDPAFDPIL